MTLGWMASPTAPVGAVFAEEASMTREDMTRQAEYNYSGAKHLETALYLESGLPGQGLAL
jgi:hypothetical protein